MTTNKGAPKDSSSSNDGRFASMHSAPIFKQTKKERFKVKVDERFKSMLTDDKFRSVHGKVDQYGRKSKHERVDTELRNFYEIEEEKEGSDKEDSRAEAIDKEGLKKGLARVGLTEDSRLNYLNKLARGEISEESSSANSDDDSEADSDDGAEVDEDDDDDDDDDEDDEEVSNDENRPYHPTLVSALAVPGDENRELSEDVNSDRIALQNCDWDNISAEDIAVVLQSFCPPGNTQSVRKVTIYVSDYGKQQMELETRCGPQMIWKSGTTGHANVTQTDNSDDDSNADLYEHVDVHNSDNSESCSSSSDENTDGSPSDSEDNGNLKNRARGSDFIRKNGAVGIVLQQDIDKRLLKSGNQAHSNDTDKAKGGDIDEVALRQYELSKLRYYFAIAECDSARTANMLYEELDGVELEASSMVFDLSLVPQELSFEDRDIKDSYSVVTSGLTKSTYQPPKFIVNALQHTNVTCSWDTGDSVREKKLTNISKWRELNESELQQYIGSSDSSDSENLAAKNTQSVANIRKLLLGHCSEDGENDSDDAEEHSIAADDFFEANDSNDGTGIEDCKTFTYIPEVGKEILTKKILHGAEETPYEKELRKLSEKKKAVKEHKRERKNAIEHEKKELLRNSKVQGKEKSKILQKDVQSKQPEPVTRDSSDDEYTATQLNDGEKRKARKKRKQLPRSIKDDFQLDTNDPRFSKLFDGDARFGIDTTVTDFKPTTATKEIFKEVQRRRQLSSSKSNKNETLETAQHPAGDVMTLANKLKRKFTSLS